MDADAANYIERIEDVQHAYVFPHVAAAINKFVVGLKSSPSPVAGVSNWDAIASCCLLAGPLTLDAAIVPLKGPTVTQFNFTWQDYHPLLGLKGDGSTKYLNTGILASQFSRLNASLSVFTTEAEGSENQNLAGFLTGTANRLRLRSLNDNTKELFVGNSTLITVPEKVTGFIGSSRHNNLQSVAWYGGSDYIVNASANASEFGNSLLPVFRSTSGGATTARIAWYHYGEAIDGFDLEDGLITYMQDIQMPTRRGYPLSRLVN